MSSEVLIIAAEASSGLFAQRLLEHWKATKTEVKAFGVGTQAMADLGFERFGEAERMAVFGIAEVVETYSYLKSVFDQIVEEATRRRPKLVLLLDYPGFNLKLAEKMYELGIPVVYYISPQVWVWKESRVEKIRKFCRKVLVVFPFEVNFYKKHNMHVDFVGHPLLDEIKPEYFDPQYIQNQRRRRGIADDDVVVGIMPGSRRSEIKLHFEHQLKVARRLVQERPKVRILVMAAPTVEKASLQALMDEVDFPVMLIKEEPFEMILLADCILAASGTATLMVGLLEKPMVIMYRIKWLTYFMALMLVRNFTFFGIVNLISGREIVPERVQHHANVDELVRLLKKYIDDPEYVKNTKQNLAELQNKLGHKGATIRVAEQLQEFLR